MIAILAILAALMCGPDTCAPKRVAQKACASLSGEARHQCTLAVKACEAK